MSYDYNALVNKIAFHRRQAWDSLLLSKKDDDSPKDKDTAQIQIQIQSHLQESTDTFQELSQHCPMTPLLWIQYATDTKELIRCLSSSDENEDEKEDDTDATATAVDMQLEILQLGLVEFPGCAMLHLHYLQLLVRVVKKKKDKDDDDDDVAKRKLATAFQEALENVGQGSHRNEGDLIASIYKLNVEYHIMCQQKEACLELFCQRARTPLKDANDGLVDEFQQFCQDHNIIMDGEASRPQITETLHHMEEGRRMVSKLYNSLVDREDEIDVALHKEGILTRHHFDFSDDPDESHDWETLLTKSDPATCPFWNGRGGWESSKAFCKYAQTCARTKVVVDDDDDNPDAKEEEEELSSRIPHLALHVYERGIAECPTVESLWLSYIKHLLYLHSQPLPTSQDDDLTTMSPRHQLRTRIDSVTDRALRNCPYSLPLVQEKMKSISLFAQAGEIVLDPDILMDICQTSTQSQFLPSCQATMEIYKSGIMTLKRHILSYISSKTSNYKYDESQLIPKPPSSNNHHQNNGGGEPLPTIIDSTLQEEIQDWIEDLRDFYDAALTNLKRSNDTLEMKEQVSVLWYDRAMTETYLLQPLMTSLEHNNNNNNDNNNNNNTKMLSETTAIFEKLVRLYSPPHPDNYMEYIRYIMMSSSSSTTSSSSSSSLSITPGEIVARLRQVRGLYQKALLSVKKYKPPTAGGESQQPQQPQAHNSVYRDHETSLHNLCHEYTRFEQTFGSEQSLFMATQNIQKKLYGNNPPPKGITPPTVTATTAPLYPPTATTTVDDAQIVKRKLSPEKELQPVSKKQKISNDDDDDDNETMTDAPQQQHHQHGDTEESNSLVQKAVNLKVEKKYPEYKVHIGNLDYPAHPFTVRVSNLSLDTKDMELVELFKSNNCGSIVHARILREKKHGHKSKGEGLVQFEERESVEKALALHEEVGLHEKLIHVERSHMPAVGLVPQGMHNVNPHGHGKSTKRNQKRKNASKGGTNGTHNNHHNTQSHTTTPGAGPPATVPPPKGDTTNGGRKSAVDSSSILAFRPRGLAHGPGHRKIKLSSGSSNQSTK